MKRMLQTVVKLETGIPGFDDITMGGLPKGRTTLVSGTAGSAKTVLAAQFLVQGIRSGQGGVFVTFEESPDDLRRNLAGFGWDVQQWEEEGRWIFVDASPDPGEKPLIVGEYDLGALAAQIADAVHEVKAQRVVMDSLGAIFGRFPDTTILRYELFRIASALKKFEVTSIITAERTEEYGAIARHGVEEFVADNVIILRQVLEEEKCRRTIQVLKFRGTIHKKGEYPFTILPRDGIVVIPLSAIELKQKSSVVRITSGNPELDAICGGGFFRDSIILVSGATGTGKTLLVNEFVAGGGEQRRTMSGVRVRRESGAALSQCDRLGYRFRTV